MIDDDATGVAIGGVSRPVQYQTLDPVAHKSSSVSHGTATLSASTLTVWAVAATLALAAVCWVVAVQAMKGMDMGVVTQIGSFSSFFPLWVVMMGAMMLPGAVPAIVRYTRATARLGAVPMFIGSYLMVWALVGIMVFAVYRPHGTAVAGAAVVAAGLYELTPLKRCLRRCCRERISSGFTFGAYCVGCTIGLMLIMVVLGVMSVFWMVVIALVIVGQKLLPSRVGIDVALALVIVALGIVILVAPSVIPGITPAM